MIASFFCCSMHSSLRSRSSFSSLISEEKALVEALRQLLSRWCGVLDMSSRSERYEIIDGSPPKE
jgi:hypothetical protein|tara:strand:- start:138 stop:332 length:195 start_codon:yes stop_codon:yes gene_type:complete